MTIRTGKVGMLALVLLSGAAAFPADAAVTFGSASIKTSTQAQVKFGATTNSATDSKVINIPALSGSPVGTLSSAIALAKTGTTNHVQANASSSGVAYFADAYSGTFDSFSGNSIVQATASTLATPVSAYAKSGAYDFIYNFSVTGAAAFQLDYLLDDPNASGSTSIFAELIGPVGGFLNVLAPNSSGSIFSMLGNGNYTLHLNSNFDDIIKRTNLGAGLTTGKSVDHYSFTIAPVPEPASWAMIIGGFAVIGSVMRRRPALSLA